MATTKKSGVRIGDWFLWIDCEIVKTASDYKSYPLVRLREATTGGDVITSVVGSLGMAKSLRIAADNIEKAVEQCATIDCPDEIQNKEQD